MDAKELYGKLKKVQEPKGYYFSSNQERVLELLEALLVNKERYGYMVCPCRLASGDRENDKDIICPCDYREPDGALRLHGLPLPLGLRRQGKRQGHYLPL
jgi:ferredoxin-thioredoxin reductase catalytic subunit